MEPRSCYHCLAKFEGTKNDLACLACVADGHNGWSASCEICHPNGVGAINEVAVRKKWQARFGKPKK